MKKTKGTEAMLFSMIAVIVIICLFIVAGNGAKKEAASKEIRVGLLLYRGDDTFISTLRSYIEEKAKEYERKEGIKETLDILDAKSNQNTQNNQVDRMLELGCDALCVNIVDRFAASVVIDKAMAADVPVIFFNREPVKEDLMQWDQLYYVGCDAKQSGEMQGEIAADYLKAHPGADKNQDGKIQYVLLEGEAGHQDAISRTDCSVKTLIENGIELEKLSYQFADWNRGQAENRMSQLIDHYGTEIELVISNNDEMALGAVEAYKNAGYSQEQRPVIFGIDGLEDALEAVKEGTMQGTVYNDNVDQAGEIARLAVDLFKGNDISKHKLKDGRYYMSLYQKVETGNVDEFLEK